MNALTAALKEELNVDMVTVFGLSIPESVVVSWGIMAFLVIGSILLTRNLRVDHITKRQAILETVVTTINDFFVGLLGESGKRYVPYLMSVALYIGCSNLIGVFGIKPPTKDLNVTAALALMSICLIEYAGIHARGGVGFLKSLAAPTPIMALVSGFIIQEDAQFVYSQSAQQIRHTFASKVQISGIHEFRLSGALLHLPGQRLCPADRAGPLRTLLRHVK